VSEYLEEKKYLKSMTLVYLLDTGVGELMHKGVTSAVVGY